MSSKIFILIFYLINISIYFNDILNLSFVEQMLFLLNNVCPNNKFKIFLIWIFPLIFLSTLLKSVLIINYVTLLCMCIIIVANYVGYIAPMIHGSFLLIIFVIEFFVSRQKLTFDTSDDEPVKDSTPPVAVCVPCETFVHVRTCQKYPCRVSMDGPHPFPAGCALYHGVVVQVVLLS